MSRDSDWVAALTVRLRTSVDAEQLARTLGPEVAREVPRARATLLRRSRRTVELTIVARDTGAIRAALNTHLGWLALIRETDRALERAGRAVD